MQRTQQVFTIFLASPSDVQKEREIADRVVELLNKSMANRLGWDIKLRLWEDTPPVYGRPQDAINPILDTCDLFVGLVWERWGQPTGNNSSGFEEEFERAKANRKKSGSPEICLFFKTVEESKKKDPGEQLKRVLDFKNQQIQLKEVKFTDVKDTDDWREKLHLWLPGYLLEFAAQRPEEIPQQKAISPSTLSYVGSGAVEINGTSDSTNHLPPQLKTTSETLVRAASSDGIRFFEREGTLNEFEVARLFLLSETLISKRYTNSLIDTHEINLLYKHRNELDPSTDETLQLFRSFLGEKGNVNPGWFWFRNQSDGEIQKWIFELATSDRSDDVRIGAMHLLSLLKAALPKEISALPIKYESWWVRESAFEYLAEVGDDTTIKFLEEFKAGEKESSIVFSAEDTRFRILMRLRPDDAFTEAFSKEESISSDRMKLLGQNASIASEAVLLKGLESSWEQMRKLCLQELSRRNRISVELAKKYAVDSSVAIRATSLNILAKNGILPSLDFVRKALQDPDSQSALYGGLAGVLGGEKEDAIPKEDSIILTYLQTLSKDTLEKIVDWYSREGRIAYEVLALDHFETVASTLPQDFKDGFRRIKEDSLRPIREARGEEEAKKIDEAFKDLDQFIGEQFAEAALRGLAKNPLPEAVGIAKYYLMRDTYGSRDAALEVVLQFGSSEDVNDLLKMASETYGELQKKAALGALRLSSSPLETCREFFVSDDINLPKIAMHWFVMQSTFEVSKALKTFLYDKDQAFRISSLCGLVRRLDQGQLEDALNEYMQATTYFYDVVTWLDRLLYSPPRFAEAFRNKLEMEGAILTP